MFYIFWSLIVMWLKLLTLFDKNIDKTERVYYYLQFTYIIKAIFVLFFLLFKTFSCSLYTYETAGCMSAYNLHVLYLSCSQNLEALNSVGWCHLMVVKLSEPPLDQETLYVRLVDSWVRLVTPTVAQGTNRPLCQTPDQLRHCTEN